MKSHIFVDSSAFFAWMDSSSPEGSAIETILLTQKYSLATTNLIFAETLSLITKRIGKRMAVQVGQSILASDLIRLVYLDQKTQQEAWKMFLKYKDKDFDFIDATSFTFCHQNKIKEVLTLDHHFSQMGFRKLP